MTTSRVFPWLAGSLALLIAAGVSEAELSLDIPVPEQSSVSIALPRPAGEDAAAETGAGEPVEPGPLRLALELTDGSRVIGVPALSSLPVITPYAKLDIAVSNIVQIQVAKGAGVASISFANGDQLKGELDVDNVRLTALFGDCSIALKQIEVLRVLSDGAALPADLRKGLVLHYAFSRSGDIATDSSDNGNHGAMKGAKWTAQGIRGGACEFNDNNDEIVASDQQLPAGDSARSVSFWFKFDAPPAQNGGTFVSWGVGQHNQACRVGFDTRVSRYGISFSQWGGVDVSKKKIMEAGKWHHVVCLYKGSGQTQFYIDKVDHGLQADEIRSQIGTVRSGQLSLGAGKFDGLMDEVMIYDRVLSEQEIHRIYDLQNPSRTP